MHLTPLIVLLAVAAAGPQPAEAHLDRAAAELGLIQAYDVWFVCEARHLVPSVPRDLTFSRQELEEYKKAAKQNQQRFQRDPNLLLSESDAAALVRRSEVHALRRREDFLQVSKQWERVRGAPASSRRYVFGRLGTRTVKYRSARAFDEARSGHIPADDRLAYAWLGELLNLDEETRVTLHPEQPLTFILNAREYFLRSTKLPTSGPRALRLTHRLEAIPGLAGGRVAVRSTVEDERVPGSHPSRLLVFDPAKGPMPLRVELRTRSLAKTWHIDWHAFVDEKGQPVWFPKAIRKEHYSTTAGANHGKLYHVDTLQVDVARSRLNLLLSDTDLAFDLPVGTLVLDRLTGEEYTVTSSGKGEMLLDQLLADSPPLTPSSGWKTWLILVGNAVVLTGVVLFLLYRRRAKVRST